MFENLSANKRVDIAKRVTSRVIDHLQYLLELHENNRLIVYSPILAEQVSKSYAANAFRVFQEGMHQFEIVRLCALWDKGELDCESVPTIIELGRVLN